jgi:CRISPR-associated protein Cmr6
VPAYLGKEFNEASPGLRFGLLLPIWTTRPDQEAEVTKRSEAKSREGDEVNDLLKKGMDFAIGQLRQRRSRPLPGLWDKNDFAARNAWKSIKGLNKGDQSRMRALAERQSWRKRFRQTVCFASKPAPPPDGLDSLLLSPAGRDDPGRGRR